MGQYYTENREKKEKKKDENMEQIIGFSFFTTIIIDSCNINILFENF